jgi:hypothetical protein
VDVEVREVAAGVWQARAKHVGWVLVVDGGEVNRPRFPAASL